MKLVIFGLSVSSSFGNGHATLWRGLCRALAQGGHEVVFFERDTPYYRAHRDLTSLPGGGELCLYDQWENVRLRAAGQLAEADVALTTSYCPDAVAATELMIERQVPLRVFYDLDAPITLDHTRAGRAVSYLSERGLREFDLVLSYTGGRALDELQSLLGAPRVAPLYGFVDPQAHFPVEPDESLRCDLSYLGTYAADRQDALEALFITPARQLPERRFLLGGAQYPADFPWTQNVFFLHHVEPSLHPRFFSSSQLTVNVTRRAMREYGYCPSGRLFEAAACGTPLLSDSWEGLEDFFTPNREILVAQTSEEAIAHIERSPSDLHEIARRARERVLAEHTAAHRATELERLFNEALGRTERTSTAA